MSHQIIYDKQFVKAEKDGKEVFYPFILQGSNNCTMYSDSGREIAERDWGLCRFHLEYGTLEEFKKSLEDYENHLIEKYKDSRDYPYSSEEFGFHTAIAFYGQRRATFNMYKNLYINGCKRALTVEQMREEGVGVQLFSFCTEIGLENLKKAGKEQFIVYPATSAEFVEQLEYYKEYVEGIGGVYLIEGLYGCKKNMQRLRRRYFPTKRNYGKKKEAVEVDKFYAVRDTKSDNYIYKLKKYGYSYSAYGPDVCKKFLTEKQADRWRKKIVERLGSHFEVVEIHKKETLYV